jgi:hypothetical protein
LNNPKMEMAHPRGFEPLASAFGGQWIVRFCNSASFR